MVVIVAISFVTGCGKKTPEITITHHESGSAEIYGRPELSRRYKSVGLTVLI